MKAALPRSKGGAMYHDLEVGPNLTTIVFARTNGLDRFV